MNKFLFTIILFGFGITSLKSSAQPTDLKGLGLNKTDFEIFQENKNEKFTNQEGLFKTYLSNEKLLFEIPLSLLEKDMILSRTEYKMYEMVRWEVRGKNVILVAPNPTSVTGSKMLVNNSRYILRGNTVPSVISVFPIKALGKANSLIIDVTDFFLKPTKGFLDIRYDTDPSRSFIESIRAYPNTIEIDIIQTFINLEDPMPVSNVTRWGLIKLPEKLMKARLYDHRMGFFREDEHTAMMEKPVDATIRRFRLEKKFPNKKLSEPKKPIIFYLDPETPDKWKEYIKEGVYEWLPAFEEAGFKNAILVKDSPVEEDWTPADLRYNSIVWVDKRKKRFKQFSRTLRSGIGTSRNIVDYRTGEILKGDIVIGESFPWDRLFTRAASVYEKFNQFPVNDTVKGLVIKELTAHEAGHAFGLRDGNYGHYAYPAEKLTDKKWLNEMGHTPSIMNYTRENYLVTTSDSLTMAQVFQSVGPADIFSIKWGYSETPYEFHSNAEKEFLNNIIKDNKKRNLGFVSYDDALGPNNLMEVIGSNDPVQTTEKGLESLKMSLETLSKFRINGRNDEYHREYLYFRILKQWIDEMKHVVSLIGGYTINPKSNDQKGAVYYPVEAAKQKEAILFLNEHLFETPSWLITRKVTSRFEPEGTLLNISSIQNEVLKDLLNPLRLKQLTEMELSGEWGSEFSKEIMFENLNKNLWKYVYQNNQNLSAFDAELQQSYLFILKGLLQDDPEVRLRHSQVTSRINRQISADTRAVIFASLSELQTKIDYKLNRKLSTREKGHLMRMRKLILTIME